MHIRRKGSEMRRLLIATIGLAAAAISAEAQTYRCEGGELIGGNTGVSAKCSVNAQGQITSVRPYQANKRQTVKIYRSNQVHAQPVTTVSSSIHRTYSPKPLTSQSNIPPSIIRPSYSAVQPHSNVYRVNSRPLRTTQPQIIKTVPNTRAQNIAYVGACNFKVREISSHDAGVYEVCSRDLKVSDARSIRKIYARMKKASRLACGTDHDSILTRWSKENSRCAAASLDQAVGRSGIDPLRSYHLAMTGRAVPTVHIGSLRDAY